MSIATNAGKARSPYTNGNEPAFSAEVVDLSSADYSPVDANNAPVVCRGFIIATTTGAVKLVTAGGDTVVIPTGLATGVEHAIAFSKIVRVGTTAVGLVALT